MPPTIPAEKIPLSRLRNQAVSTNEGDAMMSQSMTANDETDHLPPCPVTLRGVARLEWEARYFNIQRDDLDTLREEHRVAWELELIAQPDLMAWYLAARNVLLALRSWQLLFAVDIFTPRVMYPADPVGCYVTLREECLRAATDHYKAKEPEVRRPARERYERAASRVVAFLDKLLGYVPPAQRSAP